MTDQKRTGLRDWDDIRFFLALARSGTLSEAARKLRVNHATIARRTASLEFSLGVQLFERREDGYALTERGRALLKPAESMEQAALAMNTLDDSVVGLQGVVRVTTVASLAQNILLPELAGFARRHPLLTLEFDLETRVASLARREADIALRLGRPADGVLACKKVANLAYGFYGCSDHAEESTLLIGLDEGAEEIAESRWLAQNFPASRFGLRVSGVAAQAAAARAGFGLALLPRHFGDADPKLALANLTPMPPRELWLLSPKDLLRQPRVRAVFDCLVEAVVRRKSQIEGAA